MVGQEVPVNPTPYWSTAVFDTWVVQPPALCNCATMVPPAPTAQQFEGLAQEIPLRATAVPEVWDAQLVPPLLVATTAPPAPTAKQVKVLGQEIDRRLL